MSGDQLDDLARAFAVPLSRRRALQLVLGAAVAGLIPGRARAATTGPLRTARGLRAQTCAPKLQRYACRYSKVSECCFPDAPACCPEPISGGTYHHCCGHEADCCGGSCCDRAHGQFCCGEGLSRVCCSHGQVCDHGTCVETCPPGTKVCGTPRAGRECCKPRETCVNGKCKPPVEAVIVVRGGPLRGAQFTLDGSRSKGRNLRYSWSFAPLDCPPGTRFRDTKPHMATTAVHAPCGFSATLTVSDGEFQDSKTASVTVKPRKWTTEVAHAGEAKLYEKLVENAKSFGRNVCSYDGVSGAQTSGHILHRGRAQQQTKGYEPAKIADGGPFDGNWLVSDPAIGVRRTSLISEDLFPESDLWQFNAANGHGADMEALAASVRDHERLHTTLIERAVAKADPAADLEKIVAPSLAALQSAVDNAVRAAESRLAQATTDSAVKAELRKKWGSRTVSIFVRSVDPAKSYTAAPVTLPPLADIGDESIA